MNAERDHDHEARPDIEQIIREIHDGMARAEAADPELNAPPPDPTVHNLYACLREANQAHRVALPPPEGLKGRLRTRLYALLSHSFESINRYHLLTLHALNKLVKVLDGSNDELTGELLTQTRHRMDLLEALSHRIAELEEKVAALERRQDDAKDAR